MLHHELKNQAVICYLCDQIHVPVIFCRADEGKWKPVSRWKSLRGSGGQGGLKEEMSRRHNASYHRGSTHAQ